MIAGGGEPHNSVPELSVILQLDHRDTYGIRKPNYSYTSWHNYKLVFLADMKIK